MSFRRIQYFAALLPFLISSGVIASAQSQCDSWIPGASQSLPGIDGVVYAMLPWDPDGGGPLPEELVAGGSFLVAGNARCHNLAAWDGAQWHAVGGEIGQIGQWQPVYALGEYGGELIVAGDFLCAGGHVVNRIARWNGTEWKPMGGGFDAPVRALAVFSGELAAGGDFRTASGLSAASVAIWNGSTWRAVGSGTDGAVYSLVEFEGKLIAGGSFHSADGNITRNIARWNGTRWGRLAGGFDGPVRSLAAFDGYLHAAGWMSQAWDGAPIPGVGRWVNGAWEALGDGPYGYTKVLLVHGGRLFALAANYLKAWNGSVWETIGGPYSGEFNALAGFAGELVIAGDFHGIESATSTHSIAAYDSLRWRPFTTGFDAPIRAFTTHGGNLVAGGGFSQAGDAPAGCVAAWNGTNWQSMGSGFNGSVLALAEYHGDLFAGGGFNRTGAVRADFIARWNGTAWLPMAEMFGYHVTHMAVLDDRLIIAGAFTRLGNLAVNGMAAWDGVTWSAFGDGGSVGSMAVYNGELYAVRNGPGRVLRWDGSQWQAIGIAPEGGITILCTHGGELIAGGSFEQLSGVSAQAIARWNGTGWRPLEPGLDGDHSLSEFQVNALLSVDDDLIVGGAFSTIGGDTVNRIARWDGARWHKMADGVSYKPLDSHAEIFALAHYRDEIIAGGSFSRAGTVPSAYWARWASRSGCDANCDGTVNQFDIAPFIDRLAGRVQFPCTACAADANADGSVNQFDIQAFVTCLAP